MEYKQLVGKFVGKEKLSEGSKDGIEWKRYKVKFEVEDKVLSFTCFTPWTKVDGNPKLGVSPSELKDDEYYKISYTEKEVTSNGNTFMAKTAGGFFQAKESEASKLPTTQSTIEAHQPAKMFDDEDLKEVVETYFKACPKEKQEINHFIGTIVRSLNPELAEPLVKEFNDRNGTQ